MRLTEAEQVKVHKAFFDAYAEGCGAGEALDRALGVHERILTSRIKPESASTLTVTGNGLSTDERELLRVAHLRDMAADEIDQVWTAAEQIRAGGAGVSDEVEYAAEDDGARSADMETRIRDEVWAETLRVVKGVEWHHLGDSDWAGGMEHAKDDILRALLDAAPAGGAEEIVRCECAPREIGGDVSRYCPVHAALDAPSEVPHD